MDRARLRWPMRSVLACVVLLAATRIAVGQPTDPVGDADKPPEPVEPNPEPVKPTPVATPVTPAKPPETRPPVVAAEPAEDTDRPHKRDLGFRFGSYGRAIAGTDLRGGKPEKVLVVAHGPRIVEDSYLELELSYLFLKDYEDSYVTLRPVVTIAFDGTLFHDTGEFDAHPAIRNMFLEANATRNLTLWAGSRMYRGDDIYLFDYWPLDDQNTVGGGAAYRKALRGDGDSVLELAGHVGWNRLNNLFTFQPDVVSNPEQGATTVVQLNRQRTVASTTIGYVHEIVDARPAVTKVRVKLHGEVHALPSGTRKRTDGTLEELPSDSGYLVGAEVSIFGLAPPESGLRRHVNLFARYAKGLAAFDELAPPTTFGPDLRTTRANELTFGASAAWDAAFGNLMLGALSRRFVDADRDTRDPDDGWEYALDARPLVKVTRGVFAGADVSYQARFPRGLSSNTLNAQDAAVFQIAPMLVYSPIGPSAYDRPQIRVVYRAAHLDQGARDLYVPEDPRHAHDWVHFVGIEAEWWFNSSTYH